LGVKRIVLDSGALSALAEENRQSRVALNGILLKGAEVIVPTAIIAEATTGDPRRDANVNRALKKTRSIDLDVRTARFAAVLRHAYKRRGAGTIDAIVVATADLIPGSHVVTTDPKDLGPLASMHGRTRVVALSDVLHRDHYG
jgi:predicted nucleic acid-binding protein